MEAKDDTNVPNGLVCGAHAKYQCYNIFILSKFKYISNNNSYTQRLPPIKSGDTAELQYDSNNNVLSFFKTNDKLLNSSIINLPKNKTFYWMVGHSWGSFEITII